MKELITTFGLTFGLLFLAIMGLLISWLVKGEVFKGGSCGKRPQTKKNSQCGTDISCVLCNPTGEQAKRQVAPKNEEDQDDDSTHRPA